MRALIVILLIGLGTAALAYQSFSSRIRQGQEAIERFGQRPSWSPFRLISAPLPPAGRISDFSEHSTDYSRYV